MSRVAAYEVRRRLPAGTPVHVIPNAVEAPPRPATPATGDEVRLVSTMRVARRKRPLELLRILDRVRHERRARRSASPSSVTDRCGPGSSGSSAGWTWTTASASPGG